MSHDHFGDHEDANTRACQEAAQAVGVTADQAENCEDGEHRCPTCPWGRPKLTAEKLEDIIRHPLRTMDTPRELAEAVARAAWAAALRQEA